ncbi:branched-chain amino acid ABC transporter [Pusillimonas sp. T2]|uniref:branched-chain amino acid transporter permease n=1 Tax=Pusillimonas sp. T2 TaxID=1548123 RepID=UPI000B946820|nr:AzlD domain-containing protein [Pusillimonas sp. T2]OXR49590.1 branched-chain amino acid ABC transporter [Pusillimonas sp. T2]
MSDTDYVWAVIAVMAGVTFALRALPFVAGRWLRRQGLVHKLGATLPLSVMTLLLLHTMVGATRENPAGIWQEGIAVLLVIVLQWRTRNTLLSIVMGTAAYLLMRNL